MIQVGDKVVCIVDIPSGDIYPAITKGSYFIVNAVEPCCNRVGIDLGIPPTKPTGCKNLCSRCGRQFATHNIFWDAINFRKIEPEIIRVSVPESITEQAKELLKPETLAV